MIRCYQFTTFDPTTPPSPPLSLQVAELNDMAPASAGPIIMGSWMWVQMGLFTSVIPSVLESCAWAFGRSVLLVSVTKYVVARVSRQCRSSVSLVSVKCQS